MNRVLLVIRMLFRTSWLGLVWPVAILTLAFTFNLALWWLRAPLWIVACNAHRLWRCVVQREASIGEGLDHAAFEGRLCGEVFLCRVLHPHAGMLEKSPARFIPITSVSWISE